MRIEAGVDGAQAQERLQQQAGADQQHHAERGFRGDERAPQPPAAPRAHGARAVLEGLDQMLTRHAERGREPEHNPGPEHQQQGRRPAPCRRSARRLVIRYEGGVSARSAGTDQYASSKPRKPPRRRDQQALGEHLADDAAAAGAERGPHRRSRGPRAGRPGQEQIGGVHAGNQEQQPDRRRASRSATDRTPLARLSCSPTNPVGSSFGRMMCGNAAPSARQIDSASLDACSAETPARSRPATA